MYAEGYSGGLLASWNLQVVRFKAFVTFAGIVIKDRSRGSPIS